MFIPKTEKIKKLSEKYSKNIQELESIFDKNTYVYIDFANVIHWQDKLQWHISVKRLKQFLESFNTIKDIKIYYGTLENNEHSLDLIQSFNECNYHCKTKKVKIIKKSIDVSSIDLNSIDLLKNFIKKTLLSKFTVETIKFINNELKKLNQNGILELEDEKCNFDVEIGIDMLTDYRNNNVDNFILWSGDSDFVYPIQELLLHNKKAIIFTISRRVGPELTDTKVKVFDIRKIKNFICWNKEIKWEK